MLKLRQVEEVLLFLTLLFLPTQLGKHFWPPFAYIYSIKVDYLSPTLYFWDLLTIGLLLVWLLSKPKINILAMNLLLFFLITQAMSLFGAQNIGAGFVRIGEYFLVGAWGVYLASSPMAVLSKKVPLPLSLAIFGEAGLAILQFIKGGTLGFWVLGERTFTLSTPAVAKFDFYGAQFLRPYATFPHPNVMAGFLVAGILVLQMFVQKGAKLAAVLANIAILLSMSRTAIIAAAVSLFFTRRLKFIWLILLIVLISPVLLTRFLSVLNFDHLTLLRRLELVENSWEIFLQSPLYGVGLNNFIPVLSGDLLSGPSRFLQPVHNIFLLGLSETGLLGLAGFLVLIGVPIFLFFKNNSKHYFYSPVFALWVTIVLLGMFDHYLLTLPQGYRMLFLVWGVTLSQTTLNLQHKR